jgi:hypothetical protein
MTWLIQGMTKLRPAQLDSPSLAVGFEAPRLDSVCWKPERNWGFSRKSLICQPYRAAAISERGLALIVSVQLRRVAAFGERRTQIGAAPFLTYGAIPITSLPDLGSLAQIPGQWRRCGLGTPDWSNLPWHSQLLLYYLSHGSCFCCFKDGMPRAIGAEQASVYSFSVLPGLPPTNCD